MATTASIIVLLKFFASKQKSAIIDYGEFCEYLKRYSQIHLEEQPALVSYLSDPVPALQKELDKLVDLHQVLIIQMTASKQAIIVIPFFTEIFTRRYADIKSNPTIPFPNDKDLPKRIPSEIITRVQATDLLYKLLEKQELNEKFLYGLVLPHDAPLLLYPSSVPAMTLVEESIEKIRHSLKKEEHHDYFLKKITISNPGKEMSSKNFFNTFVDKPEATMMLLKDPTDYFYLWNQLCFFIRKDYEKVKDFTQEDVSLLQAVSVAEIAANFYKGKAQANAQKAEALRLLDAHLSQPPYYYSFDDVLKFVDQKGQPLSELCSDEDIKNYLHERSSVSMSNELPELLIFKTEMDKRYFIFKSKVLKLLMRLCADARETIRETIKNHWNAVLMNFDMLPEMKEDKAFERRLEREIQLQSPILYSLLTASFLPLIHYEHDQSEPGSKVSFYVDGHLIPYSEMLLMNRQELLTDAKILLPFWYTTPIISFFAKLLFGRKGKNKITSKNTTEAYREREAKKANEDKEDAAFAPKHSTLSKKVALREAAREVEASLVPSSSTLDREMESYRHQWNKLIGKQTSNNLTEDVNALIRDYVRRVLRTMPANGFTLERIQSLAETLVKTPSMQKIGERDALYMYIQLYMVKLVKNLPK